MHRHRAIKQIERGYDGPIHGARYDQRAHGNVCVTEFCSCGATRKINVNQQYIERGPWTQDDAER